VPKGIETELLLLRVRFLLKKSRPDDGIKGQTEGFFHQSRILAIDDSTTYRTYLAGMLEKEGYAVDQAEDGRRVWNCSPPTPTTASWST